MRYFEDHAPGQKSSFGHYEVTREEVIDFASKYDPQPFHLDDEVAAKTHFGRLAASGWHTCAMTMRMIVESLKTERVAGLGGAGVDELRWLKPVYPGDTLRVEAEVIELLPSGSRAHIGFAKKQITVFNQHDEPVLRMIITAILRRRPAGQEKAT